MKIELIRNNNNDWELISNDGAIKYTIKNEDLIRLLNSAEIKNVKKETLNFLKKNK